MCSGRVLGTAMSMKEYLAMFSERSPVYNRTLEPMQGQAEKDKERIQEAEGLP